MPESQPMPPTDQPDVEDVEEEEEMKLKYLDFVQVAALYVIVCFSALYNYAKQNSGPLRPGVQTVEGTVRTVIGPVYERFHDVPLHLLKFVNRKVDESVIELDSHVPALLKEVSRHAWVAAQKAPDVASEVRRSGLAHTAANAAKTAYVKYEPTAKELYDRYEPVAEQYAVTVWRSLHRLPLFPTVAYVMVPTAAYCAEKYNQCVAYAAERGYTVSFYLPFVPVERIAKAFESEAGQGVSSP